MFIKHVSTSFFVTCFGDTCVVWILICNKQRSSVIGIKMHSQVEMLTIVDISRILVFALFAYFELLYFSESLALISAVAKFMRESDEVGTSYNKKGRE